MYVKKDENPLVFVLCGFCRPGANARGNTREELEKGQYAAFFDSPNKTYVDSDLSDLICRAFTPKYVF